MKKFNKFLALTLSIVLLTSCNKANEDRTKDSSKNQSSLSSSEQSEDISSEQSENISSEESGEETTTSNSEESTTSERSMDNLDENTYMGLVDNIFDPTTNLELGSAGTSLKVAKLSADYLNYLTEQDTSKENFDQAFIKYYNSLDDMEKDKFETAWEVASENTTRLAKGDEMALGELKDSGEELNENHIDETKWQEYVNIINEDIAKNK